MGSPIEEMLLRAVIDTLPADVALYVSAAGESGLVEPYGSSTPRTVVFLRRQMKVSQYRVDMLMWLMGSPRFTVAIECDGHDWHERTKQQAAYDRARDRELLRRRVVTMRFTGSEIHHSPDRCASSVLDGIAWLEQMARLGESAVRVEEHW